MTRLLVNIDVADLVSAERFYRDAFDLRIGRRFGSGAVELLGASSAIYLLEKRAGTPASSSTTEVRQYDRHWTPVHLDFVVDDLDAAIGRSLAAGARQEHPARNAPWGRIALMCDPFGHGYCLIEFSETGYDAIATHAPG